MGADIHIVLERRHKDKWVGVSMYDLVPVRNAAEVNAELKKLGSSSYVQYYAYYPCRERNYPLFAALAGVRGDGPDPAGLPDDASDLACMEAEYWGSDAHSHTWYLLEDALPIFAAHKYPDRMLDDDREKLCDEIFGVSYEHRDQYRLIIWFDN